MQLPFLPCRKGLSRGARTTRTPCRNSCSVVCKRTTRKRRRATWRTGLTIIANGQKWVVARKWVTVRKVGCQTWVLQWHALCWRTRQYCIPSFLSVDRIRLRYSTKEWWCIVLTCLGITLPFSFLHTESMVLTERLYTSLVQLTFHEDCGVGDKIAILMIFLKKFL